MVKLVQLQDGVYKLIVDYGNDDDVKLHIERYFTDAPESDSPVKETVFSISKKSE